MDAGKCAPRSRSRSVFSVSLACSLVIIDIYCNMYSTFVSVVSSPEWSHVVDNSPEMYTTHLCHIVTTSITNRGAYMSVPEPIRTYMGEDSTYISEIQFIQVMQGLSYFTSPSRPRTVWSHRLQHHGMIARRHRTRRISEKSSYLSSPVHNSPDYVWIPRDHVWAPAGNDSTHIFIAKHYASFDET